jgi:hypothetical protein
MDVADGIGTHLKLTNARDSSLRHVKKLLVSVSLIIY